MKQTPKIQLFIEELFTAGCTAASYIFWDIAVHARWYERGRNYNPEAVRTSLPSGGHDRQSQITATTKVVLLESRQAHRHRLRNTRNVA